MTWLLTGAAVASAIAALACCVIGTGARRVSMMTIVIDGAAIAWAMIGLLILARWGGLERFAMVHLVYLQVTVAVPLTAVGILVLARIRGGTPLAVLAAALMLLPAAAGVWATHIAPFRLEVDHQRVPVAEDRDGHDSVRIAVLADLQTTRVGDHERHAVKAVMDSEPDIILLPGDLFQAGPERLAAEGPAVRDLLSQLHAPGGVYLVEGDSDSRERLAVVMPPNVVLLDDQVVDIRVRDRRVKLGGTRLAVSTPTAAAVREELMVDDGSISVLVSHRPDTALELPADSGIDLVVAGHTHGGQIALPWLGPLVTLSEVPRSVGAGGLHWLDGNRIYVSPGVGMEREHAPQVRWFVPPSIGVIDLG